MVRRNKKTPIFTCLNPQALSPACPYNPLACVCDITWLLAPSSRPPATVVNSTNKWKMTGRLIGSHQWPWVLLEWPLFGLTKKPFDIIAGSAWNDGLTAVGKSRAIRGGGREEKTDWAVGVVKVYLFLQLPPHKYLIRGHNLSYCAHHNLDPL